MEVTISTTTDGPYSTTDHTPCPHVCDALRRPSLCEARDVKDEGWRASRASGVLSGKQLTTAMCLELRKQNPLSDALNGLGVLCEEHMQRTRREGVVLAHCGGKQARDQKAAGGLTTFTWCRFSPRGSWRYTFYSIPLMLRKSGMV